MICPGVVDGLDSVAERVRVTLQAHGAAIVHGADPDTPRAMLELASALGDLDTGIDEALIGPPVMHVRFDPHKPATPGRPAYFTADAFPLHTDVSYVAHPPRFLLMHCVVPDPEGGGATLLADCTEAEGLIDADDRACLQQAIFHFDHPPGCPAGASGPHAVNGAGIWRFKPGGMRHARSAAAAVQRFHDALVRIALVVELQRGDLLVVDNHRVTHGRKAFQPQCGQLSERHLLRTYAAG